MLGKEVGRRGPFLELTSHSEGNNPIPWDGPPFMEMTMDPLFEVHMLNDNGKQKALAIAAAFDKLLNELQLMVPEGRHMSIVKTHLEEACFSANKAIANVKENQA